jgi:hypothetical protein
MRYLVLLGAALLLGGCNMVVTTTPLFSKADEAGAARLKPGIWEGAPDSGCVFDEKTPVTTWPNCANAGIVTADGRIGGYQGDPPTLQLNDIVLAAGDPLVMQIHNSEVAPGSGLTLTGYFYIALRPTKTDEHGRATAFTAWAVQCGPPPPNPPANASKIELGTRQPLPGLVMDKAHTNCTTSSAAALHGAAKASEQWAASGLSSTSHWLRDGVR